MRKKLKKRCYRRIANVYIAQIVSVFYQRIEYMIILRRRKKTNKTTLVTQKRSPISSYNKNDSFALSKAFEFYDCNI